MQNCKNCNNEFEGLFCNQCGEKIRSESDFTFSRLVTQALESFTNVDSKFLKSFLSLLFYPGKLTEKYVIGIRVPYLKPFQVFLICNIIFFAFLPYADFFRTNPSTLLLDKVNFLGFNVKEQVMNIMKINNLSIDELKLNYDTISSNLSKSLLIFIIPFWSLIGYVINRKLSYGKHLIFSTHFLSFFLILTVIVPNISTLFPIIGYTFFLLLILIILLVYYIVSIKRFYKKSILQSILFSLIGLIFLFFCITIYSSLITYVSLCLL